LGASPDGHDIFIGQLFPRRAGRVTLAMAVSIGWGVFLLELAVLVVWIAMHHR
jgi:hypothetical protein